MLMDLLKTKLGMILISIIWGLALATLFRKACQGNNCRVITYNGPPPQEISGIYYDYANPKYKGNHTCYQYIPYITKCHSIKS